MKVLFVSKHIVNSKVPMAGHQLFNYYLSKFCDDPDFDVAYIVAHKNDVTFKAMELEYEGRAINFSIKVPFWLRFYTYLHYNTKLRLLLSCIVPSWYYLDLGYTYYYNRALDSVRDKGWIPDVVVLEWTEMVFLRSAVHRKFEKAIIGATEHDLCFVKLNRQYGNNTILRSFFVERFKKRELDELKKLNFVSVLSQKDLNLLVDEKVESSKIFHLVPYFQMYRRDTSIVKRNNIIFFGAMNRIENQEAVQWFIDKVYVPFNLSEKVSFVVMGAGVSLNLIEKYSKIPQIQFTGFVEDPSFHFSNALCMVVPLINGAGIKIKVLEAMSASVTVLTNNIGIEGINAVSGVSYIHCNSPVDYVDSINLLLENSTLNNSIGENAKKIIIEKFNYKNSFNMYKQDLVRILNSYK